MRLANLRGRAVLLHAGKATDVEHASEGAFAPDPMAVFDDWEAFTAWAATADLDGGAPFDEADLEAPVPRPRQVFAIGLNYVDHAKEANLAVPEYPVVFTKYQSSLSGPVTDVKVAGETMDYEAELVVIVGKQLRDADDEAARSAVAGYAVGQDFSERTVQQRPPAPQFNLGKSFPGFGPFGPAIVTPDEVRDPGALGIRCEISGPTAEAQGTEVLVAQDGNTRDLIFPIGEVLAYLSSIVTLYPGDVVFTGTPAGIGQPQGIFLQPGDVVTTTIEGLGSLRSTMV